MSVTSVPPKLLKVLELTTVLYLPFESSFRVSVSVVVALVFLFSLCYSFDPIDCRLQIKAPNGDAVGGRKVEFKFSLPSELSSLKSDPLWAS